MAAWNKGLSNRSGVIVGKPGHQVIPGHLSESAFCEAQSQLMSTLYLFIPCVNIRLARYRSDHDLTDDLLNVLTLL